VDPRQIPRLVGGVDVRTLPLGPIDGFVLSRVDGRLTLKDLSSMTGVPLEEVAKSIDKLVALGIVCVGEDPKPAHPAQPPPPPPPQQQQPQPQVRASQAPSQPAPSRSSASQLPSGKPLYDPRELDEDVDLEMQDRIRILELHARLGELDHYAILGIARDADTKAVKRAYFELAAKYHPDRFFRKKLGTFKAKMETIFGRITEAHDTLRNKGKRAEYDQYLADVQKTRGIEAMMAEATAEAQRAEEAIRRELRPSQTDLISVRPSQIPPAPTPPHPGRGGPSLPPLDPQARRDALARRLTGGVSRASPPKTPTPQPMPTTQDAMEAIRRRYQERVGEAHKRQAKKFAAVGHYARANNDPIAAANAFKVALSFAPDDEELKAAYAEMQRSADVILAESYMKQALYEERFEHWSEAARSWVRVAKAKPDDARANERAANAIVRASGNLHEAADFARKAVGLEPTNAKYKVTLANVFLAAGLALNAKRELEAAAQLEPKDTEIQALLKRVAKAG
jgi:hypothetical protein